MAPLRLWQDMTTNDFDSLDPERTVVIFPVGAIEQHGPHLPVSTDAVIAEAIAHGAAVRAPEEVPVIVLPTAKVGKSNEHLDFPGTLTHSAENLIAAWREIGESVGRAGLRKILFMNAHGGQPQVMEIVARELRVRHKMMAVTSNVWSLGTPEGLLPEAERHGIHGGMGETSLMLAISPERVRMDQAENFRPVLADFEERYRYLNLVGPVRVAWQSQDLHPLGVAGNAAGATADIGQAMLDHMTREFAVLLGEIAAYPAGQSERPAGAVMQVAPARFINVKVPACLLRDASIPRDGEGLCLVDVTIADGRIATLTPAEPMAKPRGAGLLLPCFVDLHTHLDKGHIWPRRPNPDGSFAGALTAAAGDRAARWSAEDLRRRMDFALRCAWAHGTRAIRSHLDSDPRQAAITWPVFAELRDRWAGRITLQGVAMVPVDGLSEAGARRVAAVGGLLGVVVHGADPLDDVLARLFDLAERFGLDLDLHVDESADPASHSLHQIARVALARNFKGRITVGHCCSLAVQEEASAAETLALVREAGMTVVSLPLCNLYLQDRAAGRTPRWRGVTLVKEMRARGIPVAFGSDNTRDPFHAYGDLDMLEVFRGAVRIAQLDHPLDDWITAVTALPATTMGLADDARLGPGAPADLVLFKARTYNELLSRPQSDRQVIRAGQTIDARPPDYAELDDLMG